MKNWLELKQEFIEGLKGIYELGEAEQIFHLFIEDLFELSRINYSFEKNNVPENKIITKINSILIDLKTNKPIQHILGYAYFFERRFKVSKDVLIPRQETEELVDYILKKHSEKNLEVLDIGTGTGSIPISLKLECPGFNVMSVDVSKKALSIARENAKTLKAEVDLEQVDILDEQAWMFVDEHSLDIVVSNPPYVRELEKKLMHKNVVDFDPELALYVSDKDPLVFYEKISKFATKKLRKGGLLYFEINEAYGEEVKALMQKRSFSNVNIIKDLQEKDRFVCGILN